MLKLLVCVFKVILVECNTNKALEVLSNLEFKELMCNLTQLQSLLKLEHNFLNL